MANCCSLTGSFVKSFVFWGSLTTVVVLGSQRLIQGRHDGDIDVSINFGALAGLVRTILKVANPTTVVNHFVQREWKWGTRLLLLCGEDVDAPDDWGQTPLMVAARKGNLGAIRTLLDWGAEVDQVDRGSTTTGSCCASDCDHCYERPNSGSVKNEETALMKALQMGHIKAARVLIEAGTNVNKASKDGTTPLMKAANHPNSRVSLEEIKLLLEGRRVSGNEEIAAEDEDYILLEEGARGSHPIDLNAVDKKGNTALLSAMQNHRDVTVIQTLIDAGANLHITNKEGDNALMLALDYYDKFIEPLLIREGVAVLSDRLHERTYESVNNRKEALHIWLHEFMKKKLDLHKMKSKAKFEWYKDLLLACKDSKGDSPLTWNFGQDPLFDKNIIIHEIFPHLLPGVLWKDSRGNFSRIPIDEAFKKSQSPRYNW